MNKQTLGEIYREKIKLSQRFLYISYIKYIYNTILLYEKKNLETD